MQFLKYEEHVRRSCSRKPKPSVLQVLAAEGFLTRPTWEGELITLSRAPFYFVPKMLAVHDASTIASAIEDLDPAFSLQRLQ